MQRERPRTGRAVPIDLAASRVTQMPTIKGLLASRAGASLPNRERIDHVNDHLVRNYCILSRSVNLNISLKSRNYGLLEVKMAPVQGTLPVRFNEE